MEVLRSDAVRAGRWPAVELAPLPGEILATLGFLFSSRSLFGGGFLLMIAFTSRAGARAGRSSCVAAEDCDEEF